MSVRVKDFLLPTHPHENIMITAAYLGIRADWFPVYYICWRRPSKGTRVSCVWEKESDEWESEWEREEHRARALHAYIESDRIDRVMSAVEGPCVYTCNNAAPVVLAVTISNIIFPTAHRGVKNLGKKILQFSYHLKSSEDDEDTSYTCSTAM